MKNIEFVPMIWDEKYVNSKDLATVQRSGKVLLTFKEPNARARKPARCARTSNG